MKRILILEPSGEVYDHDCVRWYASQRYEVLPDHYHNIGDAFVYDSSLKLMQCDVVHTLNIRNASAADIDRYNAEYDYVVLRGSNYLHPFMDWEEAPSVLAKLRIPVIAFGIGAQAPAKGELELSAASKRVMSLIADRSVSIGVRGSFTADVLWSLGVRHARIMGCPTMFRANDPTLRIDLPPLDRVRRVAYTLRREVGHDYAQDVERYLELQRQTILDLDGRFELDLLAQGELEEKHILWGSGERREAALAELRRVGWLRGEGDPMERIYASSRLFYDDSVAGFETLLRRKDLVLGFRLHGNLMGLANRVPAVYFTYDSRTTEFAETFQIPSFDVFAGKPFDLRRTRDQKLFERFNRAYLQRWRETRLFLDENGVAHKMADEMRIPRPALAGAA